MGFFDKLGSALQSLNPYSSLINGVVNLGSSAIGAWSEQKAIDKTNKANLDLMRENNQFNWDAMIHQNEWDDYSSQVQRMQEAGLNPAFMFQQGGTVDAAPAASASAAPQMMPSQFAQSFVENMYKNASISAGIKKEVAEAGKAQEETKSIETANKSLDDRLNAELAYVRSNKEYTDAHKKEAEQTARLAAAHTKEVYKHVEEIGQNIELMRKSGELTDARINEIYKNLEMAEKRNIAEIEKWAHENNRTDAEAQVLKLSLTKVRNEIQLQLKEGRAMDAAWYSQLLDNAVKQAAAEVDLTDYELRLGDPMYDFYTRHSEGILGTLEGNLWNPALQVKGKRSAAKVRALERLDFSSGSSWQNAE